MKYNYWYWNNLISLEDRKQIVDHIENNFDFYEDESLYNSDHKKTDKVKQIQWRKIKHFDSLSNILENMKIINEKHFGYNIFDMYNTNVLNLTNYSLINESKYDWHIDTSKEILTDIKFTGLINLSTESYEGGEFQLKTSNNNETVNEFKQGGDVILFKSNILHRVLPITKGIRKTLAVFFYGPKFI